MNIKITIEGSDFEEVPDGIYEINEDKMVDFLVGQPGEPLPGHLTICSPIESFTPKVTDPFDSPPVPARWHQLTEPQRDVAWRQTQDRLDEHERLIEQLFDLPERQKIKDLEEQLKERTSDLDAVNAARSRAVAQRDDARALVQVYKDLRTTPGDSVIHVEVRKRELTESDAITIIRRISYAQNWQVALLDELERLDARNRGEEI